MSHSICHSICHSTFYSISYSNYISCHYKVAELTPENTPQVTCFKVFLDEGKRHPVANDAILPAKGDSKKRTPMEFSNPDLSAPEHIQFLDIGKVQMTETMQNDWDQRKLLLEVNHVYTYMSYITATLPIINI